MLAGGVVATLVLWSVSVAVTRTVIALPERCPAVDGATTQRAIGEAVGWFQRNQRDDGTWRYRYDRAAGVDIAGYHWVRHAGVLLSLEQAVTAGRAEAAAVADRGWTQVRERLVEVAPGVTAFDTGGFAAGAPITAGGASLVVAALAERVEAGRPWPDGFDTATFGALGRFLAGQVAPDGAVNDRFGRGGVEEGSRSAFTTAEVAFALEAAHRIVPAEGFAPLVDRVMAYVATDRARVEGYVPDVSEHWGAYALALVVDRRPLTVAEQRFARRQLGVMGVQVRYESQRSNAGVDRWTRGRQALPAALGTIGEALGRWWTIAPDPDVAARIACNAGMLVERQVPPGAPDAERGAWFQFGVTQMDDQQHALSALIFALPALAADPATLPKGAPLPASGWVALAAVVAVAAWRGTRGRSGAEADGRTDRRERFAPLSRLAPLALVPMAFLGGTVVDALDVSAPTALVAAGVAAVVGALARVAWRDRTAVPALAPDAVFVALACGAGGRAWWVAAGAVIAVAVRVRTPWSALVAAAAGVALVVEGVYGI